MKEIIIDGVDVAGCIYFQQEDDEYTCGAEECNGAVVGCRACDNCYYKQLKRLEKQYNDLINRVCLENYERLEQENARLKQTLQEIKEIAEYSIMHNENLNFNYQKILQIITKSEVGE